QGPRADGHHRRNAADRRLPGLGGADAGAGARSRDRSRSHRPHRLARVWLRRRWISDSGHECVRLVLGRASAAASAFMLLVLSPLVYGVYYPQPYLNQILRKVPIAVVDNDLSELSRSIVQTLDASGAVSVVLQAETLADARAARDRGEAFAVVGIPQGTE